MKSLTRHGLTRQARETLALDGRGLPVCKDNQEIYRVLCQADQLDPEIAGTFLAGASHRFDEHIEPLLRLIPQARFEMGSAEADLRHFSGEAPRHSVRLSPFRMARSAVTNELFALLDPGRVEDLPRRALREPVVNVSWFDAWVFAAWMGCRLPTEAEWEYACAAGAEGQWCCPQERLIDHAWFSENSGSALWPVETRQPNSLGLYDMHGNVWEWCQDSFHVDFYGRSPLRDPVNDGATGQTTHKVNRGGGFLALPEMCRTRYRMHDPAHMWALDLGFRLACSDNFEAEG